MFGEFRFNWKLNRLRRQKRRHWARSAKRVQKARAEGASREELDRLRYDEHADTVLFDDEIDELITRRLIRLAEDNLVPLPPHDPKSEIWEESAVTARWHLTQTGARDLRSEIRKEQRERSELTFRWLTATASVMSAGTGITGALIGLLSLLHR